MDCYPCFSPVKPKEKKATSALDVLGSTPVERESRKTFAKRENRWITNYSCFAHNFFLKKNEASCVFLTVLHASCIMHHASCIEQGKL